MGYGVAFGIIFKEHPFVIDKAVVLINSREVVGDPETDTVWLGQSVFIFDA